MSRLAVAAPLLALVVSSSGCRASETSRGDGSSAAAQAKGTIDGVSISVVTKAQIGEALKKLGHGFVESGGYQRGPTTEAFNVSIPTAEMGVKSYVAIVRPAFTSDASSATEPASAFEQSGYYAKLGCPTYLEADVLVAVCVEGKPGDARVVLDELVRH